MPGAFEHDRDADGGRLLDSTRVSKSAVPIAMPGNQLAYHPTRTSRQQTIMKTRGGRTRGKLHTETSRGDNVLERPRTTWPEQSSFQHNTDTKRRKTGHSSPVQPGITHQAGAVDLTGDDQDEPVTLMGERGRQIQNMLAPSSPHGLADRAGSAQRSQKSARSQPSIAQNFGTTQEFKNVNRRVNIHRPVRQGTFQGVMVESRAAQRGEKSPDTHSTSTSGRLDDYENRSGRPERTVIHEESDNDEMEFEEPAAVDPIRHRQLDAEKRGDARGSNNAYARANAKHRASVGSEDELAQDDPRHRGPRAKAVQRLLQRQSGHIASENGSKESAASAVDELDSPHDVSRSVFVKSTPAASTAQGVGTGDISGFRFSALYSSLIPDGCEAGVLFPGSRIYSVRVGKYRSDAMDFSKITDASFSSDQMVLTGSTDHWAAIQFYNTPEAWGFKSHIAKTHRLTLSYLDSKPKIQRMFEQAIDRGLKLASRTAAQSPSNPPAEDIAFLQRKREVHLNKVFTDAQSIKADRLRRGSGKSLVSQMTTSKGAPRSDEQSFNGRVPSLAAKHQDEKRVPNNRTNINLEDPDAVLDTSSGLLARRSARATTRSRYFEEPDDLAVVSLVPDSERYSKVVGLGAPWKFSLTYPLFGKDRATVEYQDLERLDDGEFLNDNLIEFYLRWARQQQLDKGTYKESQVHFFNTFFYEKLAGGRSIDYEAVKSWTRKVDIFNIDYVVVPVNESTHWYVCIICNLPNLKRAQEVTDLTMDDDVHGGQKEAESQGADLEAQLLAAAGGESATATGNSTSEHHVDPDHSSDDRMLVQSTSHDIPETSRDDGHNTSPTTMLVDSQASGTVVEVAAELSQDSINLSHNDGVFKNAKPSTPSKSSRAKRRRSGPTPRKYDPNTTIIITLDSLGLTHTKTTSNLKEYIIAAAAAKHGLVIKREDIKGMNVTRGIPQQQNFCDCGVFLLGYVHAFLNGPRGFVQKILTNEMDAEADWPDMDPKRLRANVRETIQKTYAEQLPERESMRKKKRVPPAEVRDPRPSDRVSSPAKQGSHPVLSDDNGETKFGNIELEKALEKQTAQDAFDADLVKRRDASPAAEQLVTAHVAGSVEHPSPAVADPIEEDPGEVMLLDIPESNLVLGGSAATEDSEMLMQASAADDSDGPTPRLPCVMANHSRKRPRRETDVDEIPDSQEHPARVSRSPMKAVDGSLTDSLAAVEAVEFPVFPGRDTEGLGAAGESEGTLAVARKTQ